MTARRRLAEYISLSIRHSKSSSAGPDTADSQATDDLLLIIEQIDRGGKKAIPLLRAGLKDPEWYVRWAAANALARLGPVAKEALPALRLLLQDKDQIVRDAAEEAIKNIGQE